MIRVPVPQVFVVPKSRNLSFSFILQNLKSKHQKFKQLILFFVTSDVLDKNFQLFGAYPILDQEAKKWQALKSTYHS